jgi:hypothetical protein
MSTANKCLDEENIAGKSRWRKLRWRHLASTWPGAGLQARDARPCIFNLRTFRQPCRGINTYNHPRRRRVLLLEVLRTTPLALTYISAAPWLGLDSVETCHRIGHRKRLGKNEYERCRCAEPAAKPSHCCSSRAQRGRARNVSRHRGD